MAEGLILFGAGASYGSDNVDVPPLGPSLYRALRMFNPPGWGALPPELAAVFERDFEAGVLELVKTRPHDTPVLQRAMAAYFFEFRARSSNLYVALGSRIAMCGWNGALATLNYERLLEQSVAAAGVRPFVGAATGAGREVEMCFPHGCCHLFCEGAKGIAAGVSFAGPDVQTNGEIIVIADPDQHRSRINNDAFPPVMSYFEPRKRTTSGASFIDAQRARFAELAKAASAIAVVGVKVRPGDEHIWGPLASAQAPILYCAGSTAAEEYLKWQRQVRSGADDVVVGAYFAESLDRICGHVGIA